VAIEDVVVVAFGAGQPAAEHLSHESALEKE